MTPRLERWSESYPPAGSMAGEGVLKQLGAPKLETLELLTREALQNCWDAADPHDPGPVSVVLSCDSLTDEEAEVLVTTVFRDPPADIDVAAALASSPRTLTISDRGTTGLAGPTRADVATDARTDFVDFVRNVGQPPDNEFGGGSFGYGKGALYLVSLAHSIVVYTRAADAGGELETRLIAAGLGNHGEEIIDGERRKLTGRHWWGRPDPGGEVADPLTDEEADEVAELLGIPPFDDDETGTVVVIVAPDLRVGDDEEAGGEPARAMELMAKSIAWHFWPKMRNGSDADMEIDLLLDGVPVPLPDAGTDPRLAAFESALARLDGAEPNPEVFRAEAYDIECQRPIKLVGRMAVEVHAISENPEPDVPIAAPHGPEPLCHIALMRKAELVVKYLKGPELPAAGVGYAGVFRCEEDLDQTFRASEPPSHDDWVPEVLPKGPGRTFVNITPKRIKERLNSFVEASGPQPAGGDDVPLGAFARELAGLIPTVRGTGPTPPAGGPGGKSSTPLLSVTRVARPTSDGLVEASVRALAPVKVRARPAVVVVDGSIEKERPEGAAVPEVGAWVDPDGGQHTGDEVSIRKGEEWTVRVSAPRDVMVKVDFEVAG